MSYVVLARKYRPDSFEHVVGQPHITDILSKAIETGRIAHAYLFCGPRGIGKTSCARIFAKALNCERGPTVTPCQQCSACLEISKGTSFDVLEIDGASNRGIDEIRTLRENVKFAPTLGKFKIYIVDEVHMLTSEAFNALLKTLEEPPEHVKFIFATTDPNKVPSTIISRCQRFDFKRIGLKTIVDLLQDVCLKETIKVNEDALYAMAKSAQGSLRDALSVLDQLSALSEKGIEAQDVFSMLGMVETSLIFSLVDSLGNKDCSKALEYFDTIIEKGKDIKQLNKDLLEHFRNLMVIKIGGKALGKLVDYSIAIKELYLEQCDLFTLDEILRAIDGLIEAEDASRVTESRRIPLEITFAKLTYDLNREGAGLEKKTLSGGNENKTKPAGNRKAAELLNNEKGQVDISIPGRVVSNQTPRVEAVSAPVNESSEEEENEENLAIGPGTISIKRIKDHWDKLTYAVSREKMSTATFLQEGAPYKLNDDQLVIAFSKDFNFHKETLEDQKNVLIVEKVFNEQLKSSLRIKYVLLDEGITNNEEEHVKTAIETFGGKVVDRWHNE